MAWTDGRREVEKEAEDLLELEREEGDLRWWRW
jgi:hypothetical protein